MSKTESGANQKEIPDGVAPADVSHFKTITLAQPTFNDSSFRMIPMSRALTHNNRGHTLMAGTWNTPETITHLLSFYRPALSLDGVTATAEGRRAEVRRFYTFGTGLNAHPDLLHGGVIATILDSTMANAGGLCLRDISGDENVSLVTAQLNVKYEKPVRTPGSVRVRAWVVMIGEGGKKMWVEGVVESGERGEVRHAKADGLWLRVKAKKDKL
ncbi:hypothetical protein H2198_005619 [Neophaeococcomyces mojaviensis]|uniref:Uncharacterized protein n=1 Tax=Neophaeococcomyces mojaviensis TaxID=3383035 RepID=A0ACC3A5P6_9EURO|nr:hypothetical protein H2198_005619 [Knufia sp. JES_112]